jgi:hypothetical protein
VFWTVGNPQGLLKLLGPLMTLGPKLSAAVGESDLGALTRVMNYPIARGLKSLSVTQVLAGLAAGGAGLPELGDSLPDRYPTAFAYLARGIERMARGELAASLDDYEQALVLPSPVPVRKPVLVNYATALVMAHARPGTMTVEGKPGERLRWVIRELAKMGPVPDDLTTENMVRIAVLNSEAAAAAVLGADVAARKSDNDRVLRVRAMVAYAQHAYLEAFVAAGAALKQDPGHGHMRIIYERSGRELKEWTIGQAGPPKEPVIPPARP